MSVLQDELDRIKMNAERFVSVERVFEILSTKNKSISLSDLAIILKKNLSNSNISLKYLTSDLSIYTAQRHDNPLVRMTNILNPEYPLLDSILDNIINTNDLYIPYETNGKIFDNKKYGFLKKELLKALKSTMIDLSEEFPEVTAEIINEQNNEEIQNKKKQQSCIIKDQDSTIIEDWDKTTPINNEHGKNSSFNDDDFISLQKLLNTITEQYRIDISETAKILLIIIRKHNILMYEYSLLSGVASYSEEYNLKAKELLNLLAEGVCVATKINNENYRTSIDKWDSLTHRFPLYDKIALNTAIIQDSFNEEINKKRNAIILPETTHPNNELQQELEQAKKEIEKLKKQIPILLGEYRNDDPLLLAIQVRNKEWAKYDHSTGKGKASQVGIVAELQEKYKISKNKASAIELVSSPIDRG